MRVKLFDSRDSDLWNGFLQEAKNSTFLLHRSYMDYHSDRFNDYSLMIYDDKELVALLPAHRSDTTVTSHGGLTYGGFILKKRLRLKEVLEVVEVALAHMYADHITNFICKTVPSIYWSETSDALDYVFFLFDAYLYRRDTAIAVNNRQDCIPYQERRVRSIRKAQKAGVRIERTDDFSSFWNVVLTPNLLKRFGVDPVHSLSEISLLAQKFPANIIQYNAYIGPELVAGTTIYLTEQVAHAQYISATDIGRSSGAIDFLFDYLIKSEFKNKHFFDFGICNEENGRKLNVGLLDWKESFGGRAYLQNFYKLETRNFKATQNG